MDRLPRATLSFRDAGRAAGAIGITALSDLGGRRYEAIVHSAACPAYLLTIDLSTGSGRTVPGLDSLRFDQALVRHEAHGGPAVPIEGARARFALDELPAVPAGLKPAHKLLLYRLFFAPHVVPGRRRIAPRPTLREFVRGIRFAHVVHAVSSARFPRFASESRLVLGRVSTYSHHDGCGNFAHAAWTSTGLVVAVFDQEDVRSPWKDPDPSSGWMEGLPVELAPLARSVLSRMAIRGVGPSARIPITAAAWSRGGPLESDDPWDEFDRHGGWLLGRHMVSPEEALEGKTGWRAHCSLTDAQAALCLDLVRAPRDWLSRAEVEVVLSVAREGGAEASRRIFAELGIAWGDPERGA